MAEINTFPFFHIYESGKVKSTVNHLEPTSPTCFQNSEGMQSGPRAFPFPIAFTAELTSSSVNSGTGAWEGTSSGVTDLDFSVQVGVHQGSVLSPFLFNIVFDYLLKNLMNEPNVTSLFFADDVAIISSSAVDLQNTLDKWRSALEENGFRISRSKTEHLASLFSDPLSSMPDIYNAI